MFTVKVQYKSKAFNLGKNVTSLAKIQQEMMIRFPMDFKHGVVCSYMGQKIENFETVKELAKNSNLASIKLKIQPQELNGEKESGFQELEKKCIPKILPVEDGSAKLEQEKADSEKALPCKGSLTEKSKEIAKQISEKDSCQSRRSFSRSRSIGKGKASVSPNSLKSQRSEASAKSSCRPVRIRQSSQTGLSEDGSVRIVRRKVSSENSIQGSASRSRSRSPQAKSRDQSPVPIRKVSRSASESSVKKVRKSSPISRKRSRSKTPQRHVPEQANISLPVPVSQSQNKPQIPNKSEEEFTCYKCLGNGLIKELNCQCHICDGKGQFSKNHPFMEFINKVVDSRVQRILERLNLSQPKSEMKQETIESQVEPVSKRLDLNFEIIMSKNQKKKVLIGETFTWEIEVKNTGEDWPSKMEVYDEENGYMIPIDQLRTGTFQKVAIGPIKCDKIGQLEKVYRMGYSTEINDFIFLQQKFGFKIEVFPPEKKNFLTNNFRQRIAELSKKIKNKHTVEFLIEKFREMGITEENGNQSPNEILLDIISTLQAS